MLPMYFWAQAKNGNSKNSVAGSEVAHARKWVNYYRYVHVRSTLYARRFKARVAREIDREGSSMG